MEEDRKIDEIGNYVTYIAAFVTILDFCIGAIQILNDFFHNHFINKFILFNLIVFISLLLVLIFIITYKILKSHKKPSVIGIITLVAISFEIVFFINLSFYPQGIIAQINNEAIEDTKQDISNSINDEEPPKEGEDENYTEEQNVIDFYVRRCVYEVVPVKEWRSLSTDQLYLIRNGIYAYMGKHYNTDYYDVFEWYDKDNVTGDCLTEDLTTVQYANVKNIKRIEDEKKSKYY